MNHIFLFFLIPERVYLENPEVGKYLDTVYTSTVFSDLAYDQEFGLCGVLWKEKK